MISRIIRIGNSQGVRIPKLMIEQAGLAGSVEIRVDGSRIVIEPVSQPRHGWADAARALHEHGDDVLLDPPAATRFEDEEWTW